jgi:hypothetical protein
VIDMGCHRLSIGTIKAGARYQITIKQKAPRTREGIAELVVEQQTLSKDIVPDNRRRDLLGHPRAGSALPAPPFIRLSAVVPHCNERHAG